MAALSALAHHGAVAVGEVVKRLEKVVHLLGQLGAAEADVAPATPLVREGAEEVELRLGGVVLAEDSAGAGKEDREREEGAGHMGLAWVRTGRREEGDEH